MICNVCVKARVFLRDALILSCPSATLGLVERQELSASKLVVKRAHGHGIATEIRKDPITLRGRQSGLPAALTQHLLNAGTAPAAVS